MSVDIRNYAGDELTPRVNKRDLEFEFRMAISSKDQLLLLAIEKEKVVGLIWFGIDSYYFNKEFKKASERIW
ncbi:MAG: hypothetical protein ACO25G_05250, partial [Holophagaceae bacterium]